MAGKPKPGPLEAFELNMGDAEGLVLLAESLTNYRARRMRAEMRTKVGEALRVPQRDRGALDCIESPDLFVVLKPGGRLTRQNFDQHDPLLRQAIVAGCAALETYLADVAIATARQLIGGGAPLPARLARIGMDVGGWFDLKERYQRERRGITEQVIAPYLRETASTSPSKVGELLSTVGVPEALAKIDRCRRVEKNTTRTELERITIRRNKIAHAADRKGHGRASITGAEVSADLAVPRPVVVAVDRIPAEARLTPAAQRR